MWVPHVQRLYRLSSRELNPPLPTVRENTPRRTAVYDDDFLSQSELLSHAYEYRSTVPVCMPSATASESTPVPNTMHQDTNGSPILTTTITSTQLSSMLAKVGRVGRTLLFCILPHPNSSRPEYRCPAFHLSGVHGGSQHCQRRRKVEAQADE
jgi:hypothetical protein